MAKKITLNELRSFVKNEITKILIENDLGVHNKEFKIGDLVWCKNEGQQGLTGLVVSDKKHDKEYGLYYYKVYFRGYSGQILECHPDDMVDLLHGNLERAISYNDIGAYTSIAQKNGITINPKYQDILDDY